MPLKLNVGSWHCVGFTLSPEEPWCQSWSMVRMSVWSKFLVWEGTRMAFSIWVIRILFLCHRHRTMPLFFPLDLTIEIQWNSTLSKLISSVCRTWGNLVRWIKIKDPESPKLWYCPCLVQRRHWGRWSVYEYPLFCAFNQYQVLMALWRLLIKS